MVCRQHPDPTECSRCGAEVLVADDRDWDNEVDLCYTCLLDEVGRLRAKLPTTKDGVVVTLGDRVYLPETGCYIAHATVTADPENQWVADLGWGIGTSVSACYSTEDAAGR